jgi:hypothetical protein
MVKAMQCDLCGKLVKAGGTAKSVDYDLGTFCDSDNITSCIIMFKSKYRYSENSTDIDVCKECQNKIIAELYNKFVIKKAREQKGLQ